MILEALAENQIVVVESPTGSGKTTQIPQILLAAGYGRTGRIGVTQPRRIAAVSVSEFIARQLGTSIPGVVGYAMRFEDRTDPALTRIKIMTDGILLQEIKGDPLLTRYSVMMVDEAHERSLNIDFILGLLKRVLRGRPDFKVIVSSATINAEVFSEYFDECPTVKIDAQAYPVEVIYEPPAQENDANAVLGKIIEIVTRTHERKVEGDILVFLPGEGMIKDTTAALYALPFRKQMEILPLYARLSSEEQERIFLDYPGRRKVIVSTNIAETSVTIDGVTVVIDPGLAKINFYNPRTFTSSLTEVPISRASANQRRGRAGRTRPGTCFRLYRPQDYEMRPLFTPEEIFRTDLSEVVLRMAELGIRDFEEFDFLSPPDPQAIASAIETLNFLDALDEHRELTETGRLMVEFPILPRLSRIVVEAMYRYPDVMEEVLIGVAFLSTRSPFLLPHGEELEARKAHHSFRDPLGDFVSYLKIFRAFSRSGDRERFCTRHYLELRTMNEIVNIKGQLEELLVSMAIPVASGGGLEDYLCAISRGLIQFVCARSGRGIYQTLTAGRIQIHPGSVMFREDPDYIVAGEIVRTSRMYARTVSPLKLKWLQRISPLLYEGLVLGRPVEGLRRKRRDFTNQIKIGPKIFPVSLEKGKRKVVVLPWEEIRPLMETVDPGLLPDFGKLRAKIVYGDWEILSGNRLKTILRAVPHLHPEDGILEIAGRTYFTPSELGEEIGRKLEGLLRLCRRRKKGKTLGFLTLLTNQRGNYWFSCTPRFHTALTESLASLESLADAEESLRPPGLELVNSLYRRLSDLLEQL
jgi:RNA helicase HrpA